MNYIYDYFPTMNDIFLLVWLKTMMYLISSNVFHVGDRSFIWVMANLS